MNYPVPIDHSVGRSGTNKMADAKLIQGMLNDWLSANKRELLAIDGLVGPRTIAAIELFQQAQGLPARDGRIDPSGPTIQKLIAFHFLNIAMGMNVPVPVYRMISSYSEPEPTEFGIFRSGDDLQIALQEYSAQMKSAAPRLKR